MNVSEPTPWVPATEPVTLASADGTVTLLEGRTFCLSGRSGDIAPDFPHGLFVLDTRVVSQFEVRVNGHRLEPLTVWTEEPFVATFVSRCPPGPDAADADVVVFRRRGVGDGLRERITVANFGLVPVAVMLEVLLDADFADLFEVKDGRTGPRHVSGGRSDGDALCFEHHGGSHEGDVRVTGDDATAAPGCLRWEIVLAPKQEWRTCISVCATVGDVRLEPRFRCDEPDHAAVPTQRLSAWRRAVATVTSDNAGLDLAVQRSTDDLGALRIFDAASSDTPILAAGAPWFMTVFGRDSLLTAWMTLLIEPDLAIGVVRTLAALQGQDVNPRTEEEPGKILHELRSGTSTRLLGGDVYYGSIDSTPLFVGLLGELHRWGVAGDTVRDLMPNVDAALAWIDEFGDRDGDGYVEYQRSHAGSLLNQGWKDSWDGVRFADGALPRGPIALCEVQAYVYSAYLARAHFARADGDDVLAQSLIDKAHRLRDAFNRDFWLADRGWFALGLDGDKRPIDALASNMAHCLWTGIVDEDKADLVAEHLVSPAMFSGWGIRTLATSMAAYNPISYHNGSVWPHDSAIAVAGLVRYGHVERAHRLVEGLIDAAAGFGGRMPELFAGFGRHEVGVPVSYPTSCSPQAWAAAAPLSLVRSLLRLDPIGPGGPVHLAPALPPGMTRLRVEGVQVGADTLGIDVTPDGVSVTGADGFEVVSAPRPARSPLLP